MVYSTGMRVTDDWLRTTFGPRRRLVTQSVVGVGDAGPVTVTLPNVIDGD